MGPGGDRSGSPEGTDAAGADAAAMVFVADLDAPALSEEDAHHLGRVLRLRGGEPVVAADGDGAWRLCRYVPGAAAAAGAAAAGRSASLQDAGPLHRHPAPASRVTIGFVPVKGERPEWVVQKLTELGVDHIVVLRSDRAVVRWEGERGQRALDRLRRVAREAAAQSRRPRLPSVEGVCDLGELVARVSPSPVALADPGAAAPQPDLRCLAVGPEGGWSDEERTGRARIGLGPGVLRAETAALVGATVLCALRDGRLLTP